MLESNEHSHNGVDEQKESLEQRVKRLEDAFASLQDTRLMEDRVCERVTQRIKMEKPPEPSPPPPPPPKKEKVVEGPSLVLDDKIVEADKRTYSNAASSARADMRDHADQFISRATGVSPDVVKHTWLLLDIWNEFRTILSMFFDIRYRMSWLIRWTVTILFALIITSSFWVPFASIAFIGPIVASLVNLALSFLMIKILIREANRYRESR